MFGTMVINEEIHPIRDISLRNGFILFHLALPGPQRFPYKSEVRIHALDGSLILTAPWLLTPQDIKYLSQVTQNGMTFINLPVKVESVVGWPV